MGKQFEVRDKKTGKREEIIIPSFYDLQLSRRRTADSIKNDIIILLEAFIFVRNARPKNKQACFTFLTKDKMLFELGNMEEVRDVILECGFASIEDINSLSVVSD